MAGIQFESSKKKILSSILEAQNHDAKENFFDAYKMYLISLKLMADLLIINCHSLEFRTLDEDIQYISLCSMCVERLKVLNQNVKTRMTSGILAGERNYNTPKLEVSSPIDEANKSNKLLLASHQEKLKVYSEANKHLFLNLNLSLQRKMIENLQIAEKHKLVLEHKKAQKEKELLNETEMRFKSSKKGQEDEMCKRQLYFNVLQFESDHVWLQDTRNNLAKNCLDSQLVTSLFESILRIPQHHFTQYLQGQQIKICFEVKQFCDQFDTESNTTSSEKSTSKETGLASVITSVKRHFRNVCNAFTLIYEVLDNKNGHLLVESIADEHFYGPVWSSLLDLFRSSISGMTEKISSVLNYYNKNDTFHPSDVGVRQKFQLKVKKEESDSERTDVDPYRSAIDCILSVRQKVSLNSKMRCLVSFMHEICECIKNYYKDKQEQPPEIGADDLLPVLTYLLIRANDLTIYIICYILMELMDENSLLGEEGYTLTSMLTAFEWISKVDVSVAPSKDT